MRVFLDTCIWIYMIQDAHERGIAVRQALAEIDSATGVLMSSELVRFECMVGPIKAQISQHATSTVTCSAMSSS